MPTVFYCDNFWWFELKEINCKSAIYGPYRSEAEANKTYLEYKKRVEGRI